ncbi:hypothetical protein [Streptomyces sp. NPDC001537]
MAVDATPESGSSPGSPRLVTDVRLSMPPAMLEYRGIESAQRALAAVTFRSGRAYRAVPTHANGQPAFGLYPRTEVKG